MGHMAFYLWEVGTASVLEPGRHPFPEREGLHRAAVLRDPAEVDRRPLRGHQSPRPEEDPRWPVAGG